LIVFYEAESHYCGVGYGNYDGSGWGLSEMGDSKGFGYGYGYCYGYPGGMGTGHGDGYDCIRGNGKGGGVVRIEETVRSE
jgi:hypothetical protein